MHSYVMIRNHYVLNKHQILQVTVDSPTFNLEPLSGPHGKKRMPNNHNVTGKRRVKY